MRSSFKTSCFSSTPKGILLGLKAYRFGFNGQEKDNEVSGTGNTMTAEFWEYDARLGRRWNNDPKSFAYLSTFSCFGNNPILMTDPNGDIFGIGKNKDASSYYKAEKDVKSLVDEGNQKYVRFENGNVSLDFGDMDQDEIDMRIGLDIGLSLINDLANAKTDGQERDLVFEYVVSDQVSGIDGNGKNVTEKWNPANMQTAISNFSTNEKFKNSGITSFSTQTLNSLTARPINADGLVRISPGTFTDIQSGTQISRASIVYHELMENYARTVMKLPYKYATDDVTYGPNNSISGNGAHVYSAQKEGGNYGNSHPGAGGFTHD